MENKINVDELFEMIGVKDWEIRQLKKKIYELEQKQKNKPLETKPLEVSETCDVDIANEN